MTTDGRRHLVAGVCALITAFSFGYNFGIGNQNPYLIHALRMYDPSLLARDWFATETTCYHPAFARLASLLFALGDGGRWPFIVLNTTLIFTVLLLVWLVVRETLAPSRRLPVFLVVLGIARLTKTESVMGSFIVTHILQPSIFGAVGFLAAVLLLLRGRPLASGVLHGAAGLMHANYLVLGFPVFLLAHLPFREPGWIWRLVRQLLPPALVLLMLLPLILGAATGDRAGEAREIFLVIRSPHHYVPELTGFGFFFGTHALAFLASATSDLWRHHGFRSLYLAMLALVTAGTVLTTLVYVPVVAQLFVWRLAPYTILFAQMIVLDGLMARCARLRGWIAAPRTWHLAGASVWVAVMGAAYVRMQRPALPEVEVDLYAWARGHTDASALFLVPPDLHNFRLHARRAVVVDWKSAPVHADELVEWYRRIEAISGVSGVRDAESAAEGYLSLDAHRLDALRARWSIDYVVRKQVPSPEMLPGIARVFENETYRVDRIGGETARSGDSGR